MQKNKNLKVIIFVILAVSLLVISLVLIISNAGKTKVYDNVRVITDDSDIVELLVTVEDDALVFESDPGYTVGDVLVSGITEDAPAGFIRKVVTIGQEGDQYVLQTEPGLLTDVFEEAHVEKRFLLTEEGATEVDSEDIAAVDTLNNLLNYGVASGTGIVRSCERPTGDEDYDFSCNGEYNIDEFLSVTTEIGFSIWLEVKLDIKKGDVVLGMTVHNKVGGDIFLGCSEEVEKEFEKKLFSQELPSIQFAIGVVPIVITNQLYASIEGEASLSGEIGTVVAIQSEKVAGFEYNSATNEVIEIKENNYLSDGIDWSVGAKVKGEAAVGVFLHLTSKLYDSTGVDLSLGIEGTAGAELATNIKADGSQGECVGRIDLAVGPKLQGEIVVTVPIIDYELADMKIFEVDLPAFWEEHWVSSESWQEDLKEIQGQFYDFSYLYGAPVKLFFEIANSEVVEWIEPEDENSVGYGSWDLIVKDNGSGYQLGIGYLNYKLAISASEYNEFIDDALSDEYTMLDNGHRIYNLTDKTQLTVMGENFTLISYREDENGRGSCELLGEDGNTYYLNNGISFLLDMFTGEPYISFYMQNAEVVREVYFDEAVWLYIPYGTEYDVKFDNYISYSPDKNSGEPSGYVSIQFDDVGNILKIIVQ